MFQFINYRKANKLFLLISFFLVLFGAANSTERTKKEIKIGVLDVPKKTKKNEINKNNLFTFL